MYFLATIAWYSSVKYWFTGPKVDASLEIEKTEEGPEDEEPSESDPLLQQPNLTYRTQN